MQLHDSTIRAEWDHLPSWIVTGEQFPTRAAVIYRGDSQPVDSIRAQVMRDWITAFSHDTPLQGIHREYLFQEGQQLFWLPVEDTVASYFAKELRPGQPITVFVLWFGAYYAGHDITWTFVVTEFRADTTQR